MWKAWIHEAPLEEFEANTLEELMSLVSEAPHSKLWGI